MSDDRLPARDNRAQRIFPVLLGIGLFCLSMWLGWFHTPSEPRHEIIPVAHRTSVATVLSGDANVMYPETESTLTYRLFLGKELTLAAAILNSSTDANYQRDLAFRTFSEIRDSLRVGSPAAHEAISPELAPPHAETEHAPVAKLSDDDVKRFHEILTNAFALAKKLSDQKSRAYALGILAESRANLDMPDFHPTSAELAVEAARSLTYVPTPVTPPWQWSSVFQPIFGSGLLAGFATFLWTQLMTGGTKFRDSLMGELAKLTATLTLALAGERRSAKEAPVAATQSPPPTGSAKA